MKKIRKIMLFCVLFYLIAISVIFPWIKKECQKAYCSGMVYVACNPEKIIWPGHNMQKPKQLGGTYWDYVGIGNEKYAPEAELFTKRGKGFWWAEKIKK